MPAVTAIFAPGPPMFAAGLGTIPGPPTRLWSVGEPGVLWVVDDRRAGLVEEHRGVRVTFVSLAEALAMLGSPPAAAAPPQPLSTAAVAVRVGIARSTLENLIRSLPPESVGAAVLVNPPGAKHAHRRWHADRVDDWLAAVRGTAPPKAATTRPPPKAAPAPSGPVDWTAVARELASPSPSRRRKKTT